LVHECSFHWFLDLEAEEELQLTHHADLKFLAGVKIP
jgi:hypothetical protein